MTDKPKKPNKKKLTKAQLKKWRKETNACEHNKIGYQALMNLANGMFARSKQDAEDMHKAFGVMDWQKDHINQLKKMNEMLVDKYEDRLEDLEKQNQDLTKQRNDCLRAYQGLNTMANAAEKMGIDLETAGKELPEAEKNKYEFSQTDKLMESGKVKHTIHLKKKRSTH
jgi:hypothetical protein